MAKGKNRPGREKKKPKKKKKKKQIMPIKDPIKRKAYHEAYNKKHYQENKKKRGKQVRKRKHRIRKELLEYKETLKCEKCGEDSTCCLDFHHKNPKRKEIEISEAISVGWGIKRIKKEIEKCMVLCSNCHRKVHSGIV